MPTKCSICSQKIQNKSALQMHMRYKHVELTQEKSAINTLFDKKDEWLGW